MEDMDDDGTGDIDFDEFYAWYKEYGKQKQGGFFGKMRVMMLQAPMPVLRLRVRSKSGKPNASCAPVRRRTRRGMLDLKFRQSRPRPLGADEDEAREAEEFRNAEKGSAVCDRS